MAEAQEAEKNRPYPPPSNVITVLHRLRSRNLPERVDVDYFRDAGVPETAIHRSVFALRFLGLVDGSTLTPALRDIATSTDEEYRAILEQCVRTAYKEVFDSVDPAQDPQDRIVNFFRRYTPASQRDRMVSFFLGVCREAGIEVLDAPRLRGAAATGPNRVAKVKPANKAGRGDAATAQRDQSVPGNIGTASGPVPPALEGLVRSLPPEGTPMSAARREQWLAMAKATLVFVYPEEALGPAPRGDAEED